MTFPILFINKSKKQGKPKIHTLNASQRLYDNLEDYALDLRLMKRSTIPFTECLRRPIHYCYVCKGLHVYMTPCNHPLNKELTRSGICRELYPKNHTLNAPTSNATNTGGITRIERTEGSERVDVFVHEPNPPVDSLLYRNNSHQIQTVNVLDVYGNIVGIYNSAPHSTTDIHLNPYHPSSSFLTGSDAQSASYSYARVYTHACTICGSHNVCTCGRNTGMCGTLAPSYSSISSVSFSGNSTHNPAPSVDNDMEELNSLLNRIGGTITPTNPSPTTTTATNLFTSIRQFISRIYRTQN